MTSFKLLFSDLDGTCVHYQDGDSFRFEPDDSLGDGRVVRAQFNSDKRWTSAMLLPASTSGAQGIISLRTLELYASIRAMGRKLILISGCRYSTLIQRLPYLPAADAYVCESGGRIFYPDTSLPTAVGLKEDMEWRKRHYTVTGASSHSNPIDTVTCFGEIKKLPPLWHQYSILDSEGLELDRHNYSTSFRVRIPRQEWQEKYASNLLPGLDFAENLGAVDVYSNTSGKKNAAVYLMGKFGGNTNGSDSIFMCDDDNDIELAKAVSKAYLPSITSDSMRQFSITHPEKFVVATKKSVWATEEILHILLNIVLETPTIL
jgi:hydroxymethylpyrimidine pyrophosphatase-like HAD family hydrolase